jgi:hypothetical protein
LTMNVTSAATSLPIAGSAVAAAMMMSSCVIGRSLLWPVLLACLQ